ncbi:hypothetical protein ACTFIY_009506 [Dictyostelium cf. discoideum]
MGKILNILFLIIIQSIFISSSFGYSAPNRTIEIQTTFSIQFIHLATKLLLSPKIQNFDQSCTDRIYNFQLETCVFIDDGCIENSFINVNQTSTTTTTTTTTTGYMYQIDIYELPSSNQKAGCKDLTIVPTLSSQFNCSNQNSNGLWQQFNELNVTCQSNINTGTFFKYSFNKCVNVTSQLNKCSYITNPDCPFDSILFSGDPYFPSVSTYSNGDCYQDGLIDTIKLLCSDNPSYKLNCYDNDSYYSPNSSSSLLSSLLSSFLLILIISIVF